MGIETQPIDNISQVFPEEIEPSDEDIKDLVQEFGQITSDQLDFEKLGKFS